MQIQWYYQVIKYLWPLHGQYHPPGQDKLDESMVDLSVQGILIQFKSANNIRHYHQQVSMSVRICPPSRRVHQASLNRNHIKVVLKMNQTIDECK